MNIRQSSFLLYLLMASSLFFLFGCIQKGQLSPFMNSTQLASAGIGVPATSQCIAMECDEQKQTVLDRILSLVRSTDEPSLSGGNCTFYKFNSSNPADEQKFNSLIDNGMSSDDSNVPTSYVMPVMIGFGDSMAGADEAQALCNGDLGLAVHDLGGSTTTPPYFPNITAVTCILKSDIVPLFKYNIPSSFNNSTSMALSLSGVGPVIVAPGVGYSQGVPTNTLSPSGEFKKIKDACPNCLTAAIVNIGDTQTLSYYNQSGDMPSIDMIGFTVNASNFTTCDANTIISSRTNLSIKNFSESIVESWQKPVVVIDIAAYEGPDASGDCSWSVQSIADFYQQVVKAAPDLSLSGVVGLAFKDFSTLNNTEYRNAFADICTRYYAPSTPDVNYATPAVFSAAGDIGFTPCTSQYLLTNAIQTYPSPVNYTSFSPIPVRNEIACGDVCFNISAYIRNGLLNTSEGGTFQSNNCNSSYNPVIRDFASRNNYDPTIIMAITDKQGGYNPSSISMITPLISKCSCDAYSERSQQICCGAQTLAYYYGEAKKSVSPLDSNYDYELTYLSVYGFLHGDDFYNELNRIKFGGIPDATDVSDILTRAFSVGTECQYMCANSGIPTVNSQSSSNLQPYTS